MTRHFLASALFAGLIAGVVAAVLQNAFVVPVLLEAELYEGGEMVHFAPAEAAGGHSHAEGHEHTAAGGGISSGAGDIAPPGAGHDDHAASGSAAGDHEHEHATGGTALLARFGLTALAELVTFAGFGLVMVACFGIAERFGATVTARSGLLWGLAGYVAVQLAPAAGLPPELPGNGAAGLEVRQLWWVFAALASATGIACLAFGRGALPAAAGVILLALPHVIGAPHPEGYTGVAPPEVAALFAARALATGAVCWAVLGLAAGYFWERAPQPVARVPA
ncbi:cobalt transporter [Paroceanicella profunda]|uniref:Cobalt transporter n=1 Tax=Paroceanicella profunda TaxID=2579971 RepID=A0A5B8FGL8_9RHOB|nr:CbtA family protein [Paroceanicella profunda]QDL91147.1 cobalt transporter [Paroceanicella profunda]